MEITIFTKRFLDSATLFTEQKFAANTANGILVVHRSKLVEEGTHDEFMKLDGGYAKMYRSQLLSFK